MALLSFVVFMSFFVPLFSYCLNKKTLIKFFRLLESSSSSLAGDCTKELCVRSVTLRRLAIYKHHAFWKLWHQALDTSKTPPHWSWMSHLCRHVMNARLQSDLLRHLFSTLHDDPMQQPPYHRLNNEHWLQSLHSKKCRIRELFSTAFRICRAILIKAISCAEWEAKDKLCTENCNKSELEVSWLKLLCWLNSRYQLTISSNARSIYIVQIHFLEPARTFTSSKIRKVPLLHTETAAAAYSSQSRI